MDFAIGIGVFILAISFVFLFLPSLITPFDSTVSGAETAQADRVADELVDDLSEGTANRLNVTAFRETYADDEQHLSDLVGLRTTDRVNVTIQTLNGSTVESPAGGENLTAGTRSYDGSEVTAVAARIVSLEGDVDPGGEPAYRLVVRVW
ncbi:DUF7287 family protein [Halopiger goleimassiliensis]|uniref:DUF7287 family protein n=1 Tax=Halopiger goleimassiliensis TaxID=1293048 RepID=UPI000AEEA1CC|nr:hypothetical protein [Halopiger goleimassiliensis]